MATASRSWSRATWISGRSMSCEASPAASGHLRRPRRSLRSALDLRAGADARRLESPAGRSRSHGALHQPSARGVRGDPGRMEQRIAAVGGLRLVSFDSRSWSPIPLSSASMRARPLLSASLPGGERVQIVLPPATTAGCVAIAIRRPADEVWSIDDLAQSRDLPAHRAARRSARRDRESSCCGSLAAGDYRGLHAPRGPQPQEHPRLRPYRLRQDHLDEGV